MTVLGLFFTKKVSGVNRTRKLHSFKLEFNWDIGSFGISWAGEMWNGSWENKSEWAGDWGSPCRSKQQQEGIWTGSWKLGSLDAHRVHQVSWRAGSRHCCRWVAKMSGAPLGAVALDWPRMANGRMTPRRMAQRGGNRDPKQGSNG